MPETSTGKRDVRKILDEAHEETRRWGKEKGVNVRITENKSPVVIFNPPRSLAEKVKRIKQETKKETD
ncbi:MAG: hypothetical protein PHU49_04475 [Syntrophorhabdaceae bacterium]|nr:hypothetical protein [Syntrophorhabdaceae bacterium]MDD5243251.1 hypothetical protein [Syntrophorhabdaceae bacterium]